MAAPTAAAGAAASSSLLRRLQLLPSLSPSPWIRRGGIVGVVEGVASASAPVRRSSDVSGGGGGGAAASAAPRSERPWRSSVFSSAPTLLPTRLPPRPLQRRFFRPSTRRCSNSAIAEDAKNTDETKEGEVDSSPSSSFSSSFSSSSHSSSSSAENEFVRAELSAIHGSDDAYDELVENLHRSMERLHEAAAREADAMMTEKNEKEVVAEEMIEALRGVGKAHWDVGMLEEAREAYEDALRRAIALHGGNGDRGEEDDDDNNAPPDHPTIASLLHVLGNVHARSDESSNDEARRWYESSLAMKKRLYGNRSYHPEIGRTLNGLALLLLADASSFGRGGHAPKLSGGGDPDGRAEGTDWDVALRLMEESERNYVFYKYDAQRERHRREHGSAVPGVHEAGEHDEEGDLADHPDVADINENIADLYRRAGNYDLALGRYLEALRIRELWLPSKSDDAAAAGVYSGRDGGKAVSLGLAAADCLAALGRHDEAAARYEKALENHLRAVKERARRAEALEDATAEPDEAGRGETAGTEGSLSSLVEKDDDADADVIGTPLESVLRHNIATMLSHCHRHDDALDQFRKSLAIKRAVAGDEHVEVAHTLNAMGATYGTMGERQSALAHFREALYVYRRRAGGENGAGLFGKGSGGLDGDAEDDPDVVNVKRNIAIVEGSMMKDEDGDRLGV